jgi:poly-gamma-glutamate synthesis protein (capsule biosynthesis protein)
MDHGPQTMDDGSHNEHRPWSIVNRLAVILCLLSSTLYSCQPRQLVTLALLGDINLGRGVTPTADSLAFLTRDLSTADLALANLESPLCRGDACIAPIAEGYNLCAPAERATFLADWGLDLLSLANNHQNDCAPNGISQTQSALTAAGLTGFGLDPLTIEVNGLTLAFFAFDDVSSPLDEDAAAQSIRAASEEGALVIVSVHWGAEYQGGPSERQETLARQFAEAGAVLVWGHHPHVLQPCEGCDPSQGLHTVILYSLGNALFDQGGLSDTRQSALVLVSLAADGVTAVKAIPFEIDVVHSRVVALDAETAEKIHDRLRIP